jgi:hypothetical protein
MIKKPSVVIAAPATKLTDLSIIGVPEDYFTKFPGVYGYPKKFAKEAFEVWKELVTSKEFRTKCRSLGTIDLAWHVAIQDFLSLCEDRGVFPFINNTDTARNEFVTDFMRRGRIEIVRFLDEIKMFEKVRVKKAYREYRRKDTGLVIKSWAELFPVEDPNFQTWINTFPSPRFLKTVNNRWYKILRPNLIVWIRIINKSRVTIGFDIEVAGTITVPGNKTPTRKEVDSFIDNSIFLPIIRSHRFNNVKTRLF